MRVCGNLLSEMREESEGAGDKSARNLWNENAVKVRFAIFTYNMMD